MPSLIQHQKFSKHCPCPRCDGFDSYEELFEASLPPIDPYPCPQCEQRFAQKTALEAHQRQYLHATCYSCGLVSPTTYQHVLHFRSHSSDQAISHYATYPEQFRCDKCDRNFKTDKGLSQHLGSAKAHRPGFSRNTDQEREEEESSLKCKKCAKTFKNQHGLAQHLASVRHKPLSKIKCVVASECKKRFNCPSAQLHHLEAGACISGMTKSKLDAAIAKNDPGRIITSVTNQWMLEDDPSSSSSASTTPSRSPILTPTSTEFYGSYPSSPALKPTYALAASMGFHSILLRPHTQTSFHHMTLLSRPRVVSNTVPAALHILLGNSHPRHSSSISRLASTRENPWPCTRRFEMKPRTTAHAP